MKKILSLLLSILIIVSLSACNNNTDDAIESNVNEEVEINVQEETEKETNTNVSSDKTNYELSGTITEEVVIESDDDVTITLNNVNAKLEGNVISIKSAKSATIILVGDNVLESTTIDKKTIKSDVDLTIKGEGTLTITSVDTCIKSDTNLIIESGTYNLNAGTDGDGLRSDETLIINGGTFVIDGGEGIESTQITINDGKITINASDDGINASAKSETLSPDFVMNDGEIYITMAQGDTDGIDSNGNLTINGGYININAQSAFDYDGVGQLNGGTIIINGQETKSLNNQFGMGGMPGQGGQAPSGDNPFKNGEGKFTQGNGQGPKRRY